MANSVTPRRRSRSETREDDEVSDVDGEQSARNRASKRARHTPGVSEAEVDDDSESSESPVLPDNYRRSPKGKGRTMGTVIDGRQPQDDVQHQPGSIVRVTLKNFVTYTKAEFHPGPNLNMVIGPNGTGKSTLVCAICLGLGWSTVHLGRAKDISEFVKHGCKQGFIEIELAADPLRHDANPKITTKIVKEGGKTDYYVDGKKSTKKAVQELARSFSIQVDNLCQFLPQDRVVEFAALSPVDLLVQTQRAAAPEYVSDWHEQLKRMRKEQKGKQTEQQALGDFLKNLEHRQRTQEADVQRLKERTSLQDRLTALEKLRPFPKYRVARANYMEAKEKRKEAQKDLTRLAKQLEPNLRAVSEKEQYVKRIDQVLNLRKRLTERHEETIGKHKSKYQKCEDALKEQQTRRDNEKKTIKEVRQSRARLLQGIQGLKRLMENEPPAVDFAEMNAQIRDKTRQLRDLDDQDREITDQLRNLSGQTRQRMQLIEQRKDRKNHMQSQIGKQASKLANVSGACAKAWEWLQNNRDLFQGPVFGPPMLECTVKDRRHAAAVEAAIQRSELTAFTVTNRSDFNLLQSKLHGELHLSDIYTRVAPASLAAQRPPCSTEQLREFGLEAWVLDLIEGPEPVLAMLCDNRSIHQVGFTSGELSEEQNEALKASRISSWVTNKEYSQVNRRREYGPKAVSTRVQPVRRPYFFTDAPVNQEGERALDREIWQLEDECRSLTADSDEIRTQVKDLQAQASELRQAKKALEEDKNAKQVAQSRFDALPTKLEGEERKLADAERKIGDYERVAAEFDDEADKLHLEKGQAALDYAGAVEQLRNLHIQLLEVEVVQIEATSDKLQLEQRDATERALLDQRQKEVEDYNKIQEDNKNVAMQLQEQCATVGESLTESEVSVNDEVSHMTPDELETEIQSTQARLDMTAGGNANVIREFEERAAKISRKRTQYDELRSALDTLEEQLENIKGQWEPRLDELVGQISQAFSENFAQIQCAGEVGVYKDEDFEQWAIQIKVKFRENEPLSVLDSHRQSGGERAVSTIFYLMALQSLARAPFRVVDEINQGMDPRNERLVHSRMVSIACASARQDGGGGSQYFLITPKLLNGLKYHPKMKVHCIASGEWMPEDHARLDFGKLAKKALAVRAASG